jgi:hypothetical protein
MKTASEHAHARLQPRLSRMWTVLLPSDTHRRFIMSTTAVLLPFVSYLLTPSRIFCYLSSFVFASNFTHVNAMHDRISILYISRPICTKILANRRRLDLQFTPCTTTARPLKVISAISFNLRSPD